MKGYTIIEIIKVVLGATLLELHFNIEHEKDKLSFSLCISDDGETILFEKKSEWVNSNDLLYSTYSIIPINKNTATDDLVKFIGEQIENVLFGVGKKLYTGQSVIYYFKLIMTGNNLLFFNNGDEGKYVLDNIEAILANDIYGFFWTEKPQVIPTIGLSLP